jgi:hypothetical protein
VRSLTAVKPIDSSLCPVADGIMERVPDAFHLPVMFRPLGGH